MDPAKAREAALAYFAEREVDAVTPEPPADADDGDERGQPDRDVSEGGEASDTSPPRGPDPAGNSPEGGEAPTSPFFEPEFREKLRDAFRQLGLNPDTYLRPPATGPGPDGEEADESEPE